MEYQDYYKTLGVPRDASQQDIKKAFRKLARQHHPDANPGDPSAGEKFKKINEAYEVLGDPAKRARYDQLGSSYRQWERMGGAPGGFDWSRWSSAGGGPRVYTSGDVGDLFGDLGGFSDFFNAIFGGGMGGAQDLFSSGGRRRRTARGQDIDTPVRITLEEACYGTTRRLSKDSEHITVKIPPGARTGTRVRLRGKGGAGYGGGQAGDLYLKVEVEPHPVFERRGDDLYRALDVDLYTAVLGGDASVTTLTGEVTLKIPPETRAGQTFRLSGRGMPVLNRANEHGDMYVTIQVVLPANLTAEERRLFEQLAALRNGRP